jgi:hypothetical protein
MPQPIPDGNELKPGQQKALASLAGAADELTRGDYQRLTGVSRSQAAYDLADLVRLGMLERVGGGRSTRYRLARRSEPTQRHWTSDRIRAELERFCAGRASWPSAGEFKRRGRTDLYVAASRYGGIGFWANELRLPRTDTSPVVRPVRSRRWTWAAIGAAAGAAAAGLTVLAVQQAPTPRHRLAARPAVHTPAAAATLRHHAGTHPLVRTRPARQVTRAAPPKPAAAPTHPEARTAAHAVAVSHTVARAPTATAPPTPSQATRVVLASQARSTTGPTPLPAPPPSSPSPKPLPAPPA